MVFTEEDYKFKNKLAKNIQAERYGMLLEYVENNKICRREYILSLLNYKLDNKCSGCDVCDNNVITEPEGKAEIINFIVNNKRCLSIKNAVHALKGNKNYNTVTEKLYMFKGFGKLDDWNVEDIEEVGDDLKFYGSIGSPTIKVAGLLVSGE